MGTTLKARRKLADLYKTGVEVRFGPGPDGKPQGEIGPFEDSGGSPIPASDDQVCVWVQPPSPLQREQALRYAQASRSKALLAAKRDEESDEHLTVMAFLADMSDETLAEYVLVNGNEARRQEAMRDVLGRDEWKDITALTDAMAQFEDDQTPPDDPEYKAVLERETQFSDQISDREHELMDGARDALMMLGRERIEKKALEQRSEIVGTQAFMQEYERQMMFYSVRDMDNQGSCFFESAKECADVPDEVRVKFKEALEPFLNDGAEAKNLPGAADGLEPSVQPSKPETSAASTPEDVSA
jgi:hypothetical protein